MRHKWRRRAAYAFLCPLLATLIVATPVAIGAPLEAPHSKSTAQGQPVDVQETLNRYCVTCHNQRAKQAGLALEAVDIKNVAAHGAVLEKVVRKLKIGAMPPSGARRPDAATYASLIATLESALDRAAASSPNPGPAEALHRLNRAEYENVIRDLFGIEGLDIATMLPRDDASYGFDNIAGILSISPTHLEKYLAAAKKISRIAVGDIALPPGGETFRMPDDLSQDRHLPGLPFGTRGGTRLQRYFPVDGEYIIRFQSVPGVGTSFTEANDIELSVDGRRLFIARVEQKPPQMTTSDDRSANTDYEVKVPLKAGLHDVVIAYVQTTVGEAEDLLQPFEKPPLGAFRLSRVGGYGGPYVSLVSILGPFHPTGATDSPSRKRIFSCRPTQQSGETACARRIFERLARRAYRRPVTRDDVARLLDFYQRGRAKGGFDAGIQLALERMLVSPDFLFRVHRAPKSLTPGEPYRISDVELASRLSFFLWSSMPDDELLGLAEQGKLGDGNQLERQVRRMLKDARAKALIDNFAGQWLRLRNVQAAVPDSKLFPDFDENLRQAFRRETELFFGSIIAEDRSVVELLDANYTFVNERLARHYGIPNVYGSHFRRVTLTDPRRGGLLGHGSILMVTSHADRTSPVNRGKWILENVIGAPPPPPPPDVPLLEATQLRGTLRQKMEQHRKNPVCATCHKTMDPLGFALENFDAVGRWRTTDEGERVDAEGALPDGQPFEGAAGLKAALLAKSDVFVTTLTERLLTYAVGRGLEHYDAPAVRAIVRDAQRNNYRFSSVVLGIVRSLPFQMRMPAPASGEAAQTVASR